jgi:hypothetical protein
MDLKEGIIYTIRYRFDKTRIFTGTFKRFIKKNWNIPSAEFINVTAYYMGAISPELIFCNYTDYDYYDVCKINNAQKARHDMEKRSLDMVLKRLVNEHFQW